MTYQKKAYAKINLYLDVLDRLDNGYHNIESVMQSISLYDTVSLTVLDGEFSIDIKTDAQIPTNENNLVYKACKKYIEYARHKKKIKATDYKFVFEIEKNIPISAGMGGGSTDCATALLLMNEFYSNALNECELLEIGSSIGADVGFCLIGGTVECREIGNKMKSLKPLKDVYLVCAIGNASVSTPEAYDLLDARYGKSSRSTRIFEVFTGAINSSSDLSRISSLLFNKFEHVIIPKHPSVAIIKSILLENGALGALMSGSGPSVFGIFESENDQMKAYYALKDKNIRAFLCKTV